ncbi:MAG TPA: hypothetical protein VIK91_12625 [Nannocystis sp.]
MAAAHLASKRGKRVLVVDFDLKAPGLGPMLLTPETSPEFGVVDALVENGISGLDNAFLADLVGPSALAHRGRIDVMPAFGRRSAQNPGEVLAKLARAYVEDIAEDGTVSTILDQIRDLVARFADPARYDVILIDAHAGLHETTAAAILGLGAEVFLFGLDEEQTFQSYAAPFAHLARLTADDPLNEWTQRLTMVHGKAPIDAEERRNFALRCRELFSVFTPGSSRPPQVEEVRVPEGPFDEVPWDDSVTDEEALPPDWTNRDPIAVLQNDQYIRFDPLRRREFPWIKGVLTPLAGLLLPQDESKVHLVWQKANTLQAALHDAEAKGYLPPVQPSRMNHERELYWALEKIGVMFRRKDGRIDMPDLYRVAAKLLKKGATAPL